MRFFFLIDKGKPIKLVRTLHKQLRTHIGRKLSGSPFLCTGVIRPLHQVTGAFPILRIKSNSLTKQSFNAGNECFNISFEFLSIPGDFRLFDNFKTFFSSAKFVSLLIKMRCLFEIFFWVELVLELTLILFPELLLLKSFEQYFSHFSPSTDSVFSIGMFSLHFFHMFQNLLFLFSFNSSIVLSQNSFCRILHIF